MRLSRFSALCLTGLMALALAGCATPFGERLQQTFSSIGSAGSLIASASAATVDGRSVLVAANAFDAVQTTAKQYLRLNRCDGTNGPVCRDPRATQPIIKAVQAGRKARNAAEQFVKNHPGELGSSGLYDALQQSVATLQSIFETYNVNAAVPAR